MSSNPYQAPQASLQPSGYEQAAPLTSQQILFGFEGRIPRRVFWGYSIAVAVIFNILVMVLMSLGGSTNGVSAIALLGIMILAIPYIWISFALQIKRWHDRDKSGWWWLIAFVPLIGGIWAFVECGCLRGTVGPNTYGPDPT